MKERGASKGRADAGGRAGMETGPGGAGRLSPDLGLGDDVIHNHVDHGSGSKGQRVRQDGLSQHHREGAEDPGQRLHHAAELPVPRREQTRPHGRLGRTPCALHGLPRRGKRDALSSTSDPASLGKTTSSCVVF